MLNLKGQQDKTRSNNDRFDATGHQDMLKQAFSTVLADQIMEGQAEDRAAAYKRAMQIQDAEERQFEEATQRPKGSDDDEESSDIDFDDMDAELDKIQATRRAEIAEINQELAVWKAKGHGVYDIIIQSEFLPTVTTTEYCVVHFFHKGFERCKVLGKHLVTIAERFYPVRIVSIDAEKAPFFVEKLQIQILPTLIFFKDGKVVDRLTGFAELGNHDNFTTAQLEERMKKSGIMKQLKCHMNDAERLTQDEKYNTQGGGIYRVGGKHGYTVETNEEEL